MRPFFSSYSNRITPLDVRPYLFLYTPVCTMKVILSSLLHHPIIHIYTGFVFRNKRLLLAFSFEREKDEGDCALPIWHFERIKLYSLNKKFNFFCNIKRISLCATKYIGCVEKNFPPAFEGASEGNRGARHVGNLGNMKFC